LGGKKTRDRMGRAKPIETSSTGKHGFSEDNPYGNKSMKQWSR
jgi:hypothetical protein